MASILGLLRGGRDDPGGMVQHTVGNALVLHHEDEISGEAQSLALSVVEDADNDVVVLDLGAGMAIGSWESMAGVLPRRRRGIRLMACGEQRNAAAMAGQWLSERLNRTVIAPDGDLIRGSAGSLFVHSKPGSGWVRFRPGKPPAWDSKRYPTPVWDGAATERRASSSTGEIEPLPGGVWIHDVRYPEITDEHRRRLIADVPCQPDTMTVLLGCPGTAPLSLDDVVRFWRDLDPESRARARFVQYGDIRMPEGESFGQTLADLLATSIVCYTGVPIGAPGKYEIRTVRADGVLGWPPFALELGYTPRAHPNSRALRPAVLSHRGPLRWTEEVAPRVYWYAPDAVVEVVQAGLWIRPTQEPANAERVRASALDPEGSTLIFDDTAPELADRMRELAEDLGARVRETSALFPASVLVPGQKPGGRAQATLTFGPENSGVPSAASLTEPVRVLASVPPPPAIAQFGYAESTGYVEDAAVAEQVVASQPALEQRAYAQPAPVQPAPVQPAVPVQPVPGQYAGGPHSGSQPVVGRAVSGQASVPIAFSAPPPQVPSAFEGAPGMPSAFGGAPGPVSAPASVPAAPGSSGPSAPGPFAPLPSTPMPSAPTSAAPGPSAAGPSTAGPSTAGPSAAGPSTAGPSTAGPSTAGPAAAGPSGPASDAGPMPMGFAGALPAHTPGPDAPAAFEEPDPAGEPAQSAAPVAPAHVPPPPPVAPPAAVEIQSSFDGPDDSIARLHLLDPAGVNDPAGTTPPAPVPPAPVPPTVAGSGSPVADVPQAVVVSGVSPEAGPVVAETPEPPVAPTPPVAPPPPVDPSLSATPEQPVAPGQPVAPERPVEPERPAAPEQPIAETGTPGGVRLQPVPDAKASALIPRRGLEEERGWLRRSLSRDFDTMASSVSRIMSEHPGMKAGGGVTAEDILVDSVAIRLYLTRRGSGIDSGLRSGANGPHVPFARCAVSGLSRLPSFRGSTITRLTPEAAEWDVYRDRKLITDWAFSTMLTAPCEGQDGDTDLLIWSMTARRTGLLEPEGDERVDDRVVFLPGTSFKVLEITEPDGDTRGTILLREIGANEIGDDGRVDQNRMSLDELAVTSLRRSMERWAGAAPRKRIGAAATDRFGVLPGLVRANRPGPSEGVTRR